MWFLIHFLGVIFEFSLFLNHSTWGTIIPLTTSPPSHMHSTVLPPLSSSSVLFLTIISQVTTFCLWHLHFSLSLPDVPSLVSGKNGSKRGSTSAALTQQLWMFGSALGLGRFKPAIEFGRRGEQSSTSGCIRINFYCLQFLTCFHDGHSTFDSASSAFYVSHPTLNKCWLFKVVF